MTAVILLSALVGCDGGPPTTPGDVNSDRQALAGTSEGASLRPGWILGVNNFADESGVRTGVLLRIDATSGASTPVGPPLPSGGVALAFDEHNGRVYGALTPSSGPSQLVRLDPLTGAATLVGAIMLPDQETSTARVAALDFVSGYLTAFTRRGEMIQIDPATGRAKLVASIGIVPGVYGSAVGRDGIPYFFDLRRHSAGGFVADLYKVAPTGALYPVSRYSLATGGSAALSQGPGREFYAAIGNLLYRRDASATSLTLVGDIGHPGVSGLTFVDEVALRCPCGGSWSSQGAYLDCVGRLASDLLATGRITASQDAAIRATAAANVCYGA